MKKILFLALILISFSTFPGKAFCEGYRIAVFPFKNNGQSQLNGLSSGFAAMFTTDLTKSKQLEVIDPQRVMAALGKARLSGGAPSLEDALKAAAALGADYAVTGEFVSFGTRFRIDIRLYDVKTGALMLADKAQAKEDALFDMVDELSGKVIAAITGAAPSVGGTLVVSSEPAGAKITLDGEASGETPKTFKGISAGQHKVDLAMDGYQPYSKTVTVPEGETVKVEAKLIRLFGGIRVWWKEFPTSDINLSPGESIPMSLFQGNLVLSKYCKNIPSGTYKVAVRLPYKEESSWENTKIWKTYSAEFELGPGEVVDIFIDNNMFSPKIEVSSCGPCTANWDFTAKISWYEMQ